MFRLLVFASLLLFPFALHAQGGSPPPPPAPDSAVLRAQRMVSLGQGEAGRALLDSIVQGAPPGSPALAEALFWRASLASTEESAERDYRRLAVEFPLSPRAGDALIRLAQMELTRGNAELAQRHLQRLIAEHPVGSARARAGYWLARAYLQGGDTGRGCEELETARQHAGEAEVQLLAQIRHASERCTAEARQIAAGAAAVAGDSAAIPPAGAQITIVPPITAAPPVVDSTRPTVTGNPPSGATPPVVDSTRPPVTGTPPAGAATPPVSSRTQAGPQFSVQVAAFPARASAQAMVAQLAQRGIDARVFGTAAPFRVRVGRYATRAEASAAAERLRTSVARDAFVVEAEPR